MFYKIAGLIIIIFLLVDYVIYLAIKFKSTPVALPGQVPPPNLVMPAPAPIPSAPVASPRSDGGTTLLQSVENIGTLATQLVTQDLANRISTLEGTIKDTFSQIKQKPLISVTARSANDTKPNQGTDT